SKEGSPASSSHEKLLAVGGRYDMLMENAWDNTHKTKPPGAVGVSIALEKFLPNNPSSDVGLPRIENSISVLVCSKGGGGLLNERMELVAELWEANIKVNSTQALQIIYIIIFSASADRFTIIRPSLFLRKTQVFKNNMSTPVIMTSNALCLSLKQVFRKQIL
uniref:Class II Histidinyl-tRNA synthetase (HisRS)-like catalytic core domain-containing protein n=1 Tax=Aegilops tauschii subsp. strangulata TaxID=200361 RepID=A0A453CA91_AEGTS